MKVRWTYLDLAVTGDGATIDVYLSRPRNAQAAKRFLGKGLRAFKDWETPNPINTDEAGCYGQAIGALKKDGKLPDTTRLRHRTLRPP